MIRTHTRRRIVVIFAFNVCVGLSIAQVQPEPKVRFAWFPDFSPNGELIVVPYGGWKGSEQGEVRVWSIESGNLPSPPASGY